MNLTTAAPILRDRFKTVQKITNLAAMKASR